MPPQTQTQTLNQIPTNLQAGAKYFPGKTILNKVDGTLALIDGKLSFTDKAGNKIYEVGPSDVKIVMVTATFVSVKTVAGQNYRVEIAGASGQNIAGAVLGGVVGLLLMRNAAKTADTTKWLTALKQYGFQTNDLGFKKSLIIGLVFGFAIIIFLFIIAFVGSAASGN